MPHAAIDQPKILLVEDSGTICGFVRRLLKNGIPGATVTACQDGQAALEALRQQTYGVPVTDLQMPQLGGEAFLLKGLQGSCCEKCGPALLRDREILTLLWFESAHLGGAHDRHHQSVKAFQTGMELAIRSVGNAQGGLHADPRH